MEMKFRFGEIKIMKHFPNLNLVFGITLSLCFLSSINILGQNASHSVAKSPDAKTHYTSLGKALNIYDEHDNLAGFLVRAYTDICGSDCVVEVLFLKINANDEIAVSKIASLSEGSLGNEIFEKNKNVYKSTYIAQEGEGHFGCHQFMVEKIKYVNGKLELKEEFRTLKKYAFDIGDAQGHCNLFPGIEKILQENGY